MLLVDHMISGELILYPPFLTAGIDKIIPEVITVGVPMTIVVFSAWIVMIIVSAKFRKTELHAKSS